MDSILYYDPSHHHDPTIINVHTLLKPQPYQQPNYISHNQHLSYHTPPISTTDIGSVVNQLLQSQEEFKHTLSVFANEVSLLQTTLTPSFNHHQPLTQHQQPYISYTPFNHQSPLSFTPNLQTNNGYEEPIQQPLSSLHITQHPILTTVPSPFSSTHTKPKQNCFSHIPSHHHHTPFFISTELSETTKVTNKRPTTDEKIIHNIVHGHEFAVTTKFVEPEINNRGDLHEHVVSDGDFTFLIVDSISQVDDKEKKFVTIESVGESVFRISKPQEKPVNATMRLAPDLMRFSYSMFAKSISAATASLPEKTVPHIVIVTTPLIRRSFIFDPGGAESLSAIASKLDTVKFLEMKRRRQPATVSFLISGAALGAASGRPWVPWYRLHSVTNGGVDVFDPDGNKFMFNSPARIDGNNRRTLSLLWMGQRKVLRLQWIGNCMVLGLESSRNFNHQVQKMGLVC